MALPRLGGAPNVWNSAMLVYQLLLLGGYAYAHWLGQRPIRRQATIHLALLALASLTLPIGLVGLPPPVPGWEALWVPLLLGLSIGPVFLLVSAQAPLMQNWYSAHPAAGSPWALYAVSNVGSFAGLIAYPLLVEPLVGARGQSLGWTAGYAVLIILVAISARSRWNATPLTLESSSEDAPAISRRQIALWLALSAVPSGLMLSTTTHLTTDIFAMPLLWVIPLGTYLLSFVVAFADNRVLARLIGIIAPAALLLAGSLAMISQQTASLVHLLISVGLLFVICVALHGRLYDSRPDASNLTKFYLVMSVGGAIGGLFTALIAPIVFNWTWEHPILMIAAALLLPLDALRRILKLDLDPRTLRFAAAGLTALAAVLAMYLTQLSLARSSTLLTGLIATWISGIGVLLARQRALFISVFLMLTLAQGGVATIDALIKSPPTRSYFGIYTVRDYASSRLGGSGVRDLMHGTTLHGRQALDPARRKTPTTYYGSGSGVGLALANAPALFGPHARVGIVGLGAGTLACYHQPGQAWRFFEIDPAVLHYSTKRAFTYLSDCAPDAAVTIGDARLELAKLPQSSFDVLAIDAFSSDAIPLHLLTDEAFGIYLDRLTPRGLLLVHISNRFFDLRPVLAALARRRGLSASGRLDQPPRTSLNTISQWIALSRDPATIKELGQLSKPRAWQPLVPGDATVWTDDYASILPYLK